VPELPREFALIERHFRPLAGTGALDLTDDAAVVAPPPGRELVLTADAMVAGVHFLPDDPPGLIGRKLLRVNLSDLAAKGAEPLGYLLTVATARETQDQWFADFTDGLAQDQARFGIRLLGGDTVSTPGPVTLSLTAMGHVAPSGAVRRAGACADDAIWVTGTIGDGALGLMVARGQLTDPTGFLLDRYRLPQPRLGLRIAGIANAAMDVSDGLVQDLGHLCQLSGLRAEIAAENIPLSAAAREAGPNWFETCVTGGDDYELLLAVSPEKEDALVREAQRVDVPVQHIGYFRSGLPGAVMLREGRELSLSAAGWSHFP
jgi:thiamine-monophosphate kinase